MLLGMDLPCMGRANQAVVQHKVPKGRNNPQSMIHLQPSHCSSCLVVWGRWSSSDVSISCSLATAHRLPTGPNARHADDTNASHSLHILRAQACMAARGFRVLIADESHAMRANGHAPDARHTEAVAAAAARAQRVILLTGTPSLSKPFDLFRQVNIVTVHLQETLVRAVSVMAAS